MGIAGKIDGVTFIDQVGRVFLFDKSSRVALCSRSTWCITTHIIQAPFLYRAEQRYHFYDTWNIRVLLFE